MIAKTAGDRLQRRSAGALSLDSGDVQATMATLQAELGVKVATLAALAAELEAARAEGTAQSPPSEIRVDANVAGDAFREIGLSSPMIAGRDMAVAVDLFAGRLPKRPDGLASFLRSRVTAALSLGTLRRGDRLPTIRELARRTGLNHKAVGRVYRTLEHEALVEVRDRSGIYVSGFRSHAAPRLDETEEWAAETVYQAVGRGIGFSTLPDLLHGYTRARVLRCARVASTEDHRVSLCRGIETQFGMETASVRGASPNLSAELVGADLVVTTPFDAAHVRSALRPGQPLVVANLHPLVHSPLNARTDAGACVLICADPIAADRLLHGLGAAAASRVRPLNVDEAVQSGALPECQGAITFAAWKRAGSG